MRTTPWKRFLSDLCCPLLFCSVINVSLQKASKLFSVCKRAQSLNYVREFTNEFKRVEF